MENICIEMEGIEVSFLEKMVLKIPHLNVHQFDRIGIVGKNGAGKSTLLKVMKGDIIPDRGYVHRLIDVAYFDQMQMSQQGTLDGAMRGKLSIPEVSSKHFSGGEETRFSLAHIFSEHYEGILLDEPTTHLDAEGIQFLIDQLTYYYGMLVLVSHDRFVLDALVTTIWEVEGGGITAYKGNYTDYVAQKKLEERQHLEQHEQYMKEKGRLEKAVEEKMAKAEKVMKQSKRVSKKGVKTPTNRMFMTKSKETSQKGIQRGAKALEQRINQLEEVEAPVEDTPLIFKQPRTLQLHNKFPIMAQDLSLSAGNKTLFKDAQFQFPLGKTIAITGRNGSGKTTLFRHLLKRGEGLTISPKVTFGTYEQMDYRFTESISVLAYMKRESVYDEGMIRTVLHRMDFNEGSVHKNIQQLSGGEAIRLVLCRLFLGEYNVLLLDEPTTFLDIFCLEALEEFITAYEGTVLLISHDQSFVDRIADDVYVIENQKIYMKPTE